MDEEHQLRFGGANAVRAEGHWLVVAPPDNPTIRFDARILDSILADQSDLHLVANDMTLALMVPGGVKAARDIAAMLAPFTRSAPIALPEAYEEAKRRHEVARGLRPDSPPPAFLFGDEAVRASGNFVSIGDVHCRISDVAHYSKVGANLPLPKGKLQAGLVMLLVSDARRREDPADLARRIAEYEARVAR